MRMQKRQAPLGQWPCSLAGFLAPEPASSLLYLMENTVSWAAGTVTQPDINPASQPAAPTLPSGGLPAA